jgi:hypothetical protein
VQVCLVESEVIVGEKAFKSRVNFDIIVVVNRVNVTAAIVDCAFQL